VSAPASLAAGIRPEDLRGLLAVPFTGEQLAAATAPLEPALVVAGAGSGKTSVMAARVVWLVATGRVSPDRVLGLTFTVKAAGELAGRIRGALARLGGHRADDAGEPVVSTYHAYAGRLVAEHGLRLGVEPRARLLADATRFQLAGRVLRRHRRPVRELTSPLRMLVGHLVSLEAEMSEHLVPVEALRNHDERWLAELSAVLPVERGKRNNRGHVEALERCLATARGRLELAAIVADYRAAKRDLDAVDFGDQVALAARLAETRPQVGAAERDRAQVVLLDEYQDTSVAQRRMLAGVFGGGHPVTAVGDPCQAIYGWRGASVANLDAFPAHFPRSDGGPARRYALTVNQRSGGRLLRLANTVAALLRRRHDIAELAPRADVAEHGHTVVALHDSWRDEVRWVAAQIRAAVDAGRPPGGCAVLVRARADIPDLYDALLRAGLPVEVVGLGGLLSLPEVADVVAVLEVLDDPTANPALLRLLTGPRWRIGPRDLAALGRRAAALLGRERADDSSGAGDHDPEAVLEDAVAGIDPCDVVALADALTSPGPEVSEAARARLQALGRELAELRRHDQPLPDLLRRVVEATGLDVELAAHPAAVAARRGDTLAAFLDVAAGFVDLDGESALSSFLAFLRAAEEHDRGLDSTTPAGSDAVQLLTVHKAKGLEWDVVAVPDLTRGVFPVDRVRDKWIWSAAVLPAPLRGDAAEQPGCGGWTKVDLGGYDAACREHLEREERRLGYVAVTRARSLLIGSGHWWGPTQQRRRGPSAFLEELRHHCAAGHGSVEVWEPAPEPDRNPHLAAEQERPWPAPYEPAAWTARKAAADAVLADLAVLEADGELPPDDLNGLLPGERAQLEALDHDLALLLAEAGPDRDPVREVALPATVTTSQLLRLAADPAGLARELARPLPRRPVPAARRGTRFHAWVETLFAARPLLDPDDLPGAQDDAAVDDEEFARLQVAFLRSPYAARPPYAVEAPFALALEGRVVRGRIDAVYDLGGGRWEVVDWKTGDEPADPLQLAVYRLAWARLAGVSEDAVGAAFLYVRSGAVVHPPPVAAADLARLLGDPAGDHRA
jgi:DNA helicase-2/ATP-dependent DNA helicase PcrA